MTAIRSLTCQQSSAAGVPRDMLALIAGGAAAQAAVKTAAAKAPASARLALAAIKPALPIARPPKFVCVGLNYAEHAKEGGHAIPTYPSFFLRVDTSLDSSRSAGGAAEVLHSARLRVRAHRRHR